MSRKTVCGYVFIAIYLFLGIEQLFAESQITADLRGTIDQVLKIVSDKNLQKDPTLRREKLRQVISLRFNYKQMVMRSLAKNYNERSDEEREEFTGLFKKLLENSYASKIENYQDETINYVDEKIKGNYAMVRTQIVRKDGVIDVDYKMLKDNGQWLVYDVVVDNISLVTNYRGTYASEIKRAGLESLIDKLEKQAAG